LYEEMYTRICENGPADPVLKALSRDLALLAASGGDLIEQERGLQWLPIRSYVRDSDLLGIGRGLSLAVDTMAAIIEKTESEEHKAALYQERSC
jgi:hypothetical protein